MKTIIAATDFSNASVNAVLFAADMALEVNASLQIYHAVPERVVLIDNMDYDAEYAEAEEAMRQLETLQEKIKNYSRHRLSTAIQLKYGSIDQVLEEICRQTPPFAVVMSATEKDAAARFWLGSNTLSVSSTIQVPLLLVPHEAKFKGFKKTVIATDLKEVCDTMPLDNLTRWIETFKPSVEFLFVKEDDRFEAANVSEAVALQTHFQKYMPSFRYIKNKDTADGINTYLNENWPDVLVIIPKKHTPFHKRISTQFIVQPTVPTMVLMGHH